MHRILVVVLLVGALCHVGVAENWPNWRGPNYDGVAAGKGYPTNWGPASQVRWKLKLPGPGASTPIVWEDRIYLTCGVDGKNAVVCVDREGKQRWLTALDAERQGKHKKATGSNPSCVTDGRYIYAYFKSGTLACLDTAGKLVWQQNLQSLYGEDTLWWDLGTSPVLTKKHVVVAVMQTGPSYLAAFERDTGKLAWKQDRNVDAPNESAQSYSTPLVFEHQGHELMVVLGADHVTAHDAATGAELWRVGGLNPTGNGNFRSIASPVVTDGIVVAPYGRGATIIGIRLGGKGDVTKTHVLWNRQGISPDVPTPAVLGGRVYVLGDTKDAKGEINCLDVKTGETVSSARIEKSRFGFSSSPIVADGKLYVTREDGKTFVFTQTPEMKQLAANELEAEGVIDTPVVTTPVLVDGQVLIRTQDQLYCFGN